MVSAGDIKACRKPAVAAAGVPVYAHLGLKYSARHSRLRLNEMWRDIWVIFISCGKLTAESRPASPTTVEAPANVILACTSRESTVMSSKENAFCFKAAKLHQLLRRELEPIFGSGFEYPLFLAREVDPISHA